ncbi:MFS transporter [Paenibacillus thermoaerophilus]|jgi:DHA1 family multidrug resistance protein-like MFS transporter|uniref:MFS transporter n=1 Tax=Paenibacillus thermoaerophilus TaxID=1215385 RepID=A0ABW2V6I6_9BACL|nr:MFS transporter [Paenibacillus thermoaerophilus]TMV18761.1 TCR/Tet family MFS transporter [Paenibacillus thermoaerophilus]
MNQRLLLVAAIVFLVFVGFGIIIPVMPSLMSPTHLSWMLAAYSVASFLMSPVWGALSDRIGRRPVLLLGLTGFAVSFALFGLASGELWLMYVSRLLGGLFSGATMACAVAYVADITTEEKRTSGMGLIGMAIGLGFVFGPGMGGLLSALGSSVPFFVASALTVGTLLLASAKLPESLSPDKRGRTRAAGQSRWSAFRGVLRPLYMLSFIVTFSMTGMETTIFYFLGHAIDADSRDMGILLTISGLVGALIQGGVVRRFVKRGDEVKVVSIGLVLSAAGLWLLLASSSFWTSALYLSVFAVGNALIRPCVTSLITLKAGNDYGAASGLSSAMDSLGRIVGPLAGGYLYLAGMNWPFAAGGLLCLLSLGFVVWFMRADRTAEVKASA